MVKSTIVRVIRAGPQLALLASVTAALLLLLAACGGDSGSAQETTGAATAAPAGSGTATAPAPASTTGGSEPTRAPGATAQDTPVPATLVSDAPVSNAPDSDAPAGATVSPATAPAPQPTPGDEGAAPQAEVPTAETVATDPPPIATPEPQYPPRMVGGGVGDQAPEFSGIDAWINSSPLTMDELRGKVVLVDFWTYTCVNCIRTYPYLKLWHSRYFDDGLVIVGVHAPEFEFEKDYDNVVQASMVDGIVWPIAQDNEFSTWRSYDNRYWPAKYLVDQDGVVRYTHFGEGGYAETEEKIRELLFETGVAVNDENLPLPEDQTLDPDFQNARGAEVTRELYAGYERGRNDLLYGRGGYVGQDEYYNSFDMVGNFETPGELEPHQIYLQGPWHIGPESSRHGADSANFDDYLSLVYSARTVYAVLTSDSGVPYKVRLTAGGEYLTDENKGEDVIIGDDGESYLWVTEPKMYSVIDNPAYVRRQELKMSSDSEDFGLFAFTFGVYKKESSE